MADQDRPNARPAPDLRLFDAFILAGTPIQPPLNPARTPETLLAEMDRCGVDEALVVSDELDLSSPLTTNPKLVRFCSATPRLHPVWTLLPPQTGEMRPERLFDEMKDAGVRALHAWPEGNLYQLNAMTMGSILDEMVRRRVPLFLNRRKTGWPVVTDLLKTFPDLVLVYTGGSQWGHDRFARPLLEAFDHFYLDTATYELDGGLEELVAEYGPSKIVFSSAFHNRAMGGPALQLRNADLDEYAKDLIAHGNIERILEEARL